MPYILNVRDNFDGPEHRGQDVGRLDTYEEAVAAAKDFIDTSLRRCLKSLRAANRADDRQMAAHKISAEALTSHWAAFGDNVYIFAVNAPDAEVRFNPYEYVEVRAATIIDETA